MAGKKVLITNDDGIHSDGLFVARKAVQELAENIVVAPAEDSSGTSLSATTGRVLNVNRVRLFDGTIGYSITGTPIDAVRVGITAISNVKPILVISGINRGLNLGHNVIYSGTVGAALEACRYGVPSLAISLEPCRGGASQFGLACDFLERISKLIIENAPFFTANEVALNINIPCEADSNTKVRTTRVSKIPRQIACEFVKEGSLHALLTYGTERASAQVRITSSPTSSLLQEENDHGTDVYAVLGERAISVTPLRFQIPASVDRQIMDRIQDLIRSI